LALGKDRKAYLLDRDDLAVSAVNWLVRPSPTYGS
jgi:hypothetical protein